MTHSLVLGTRKSVAICVCGVLDNCLDTQRINFFKEVQNILIVLCVLLIITRTVQSTNNNYNIKMLQDFSLKGEKQQKNQEKKTQQNFIFAVFKIVACNVISVFASGRGRKQRIFEKY